MADRIYITTTLPYVNAEPHVGFALELVQADIIARYKRLMGREVFFNTGTDEHGLKIYRAALAARESPPAYVNRYARRYQELQTVLNISADAFVRTSSPHHAAAAQELWRRCANDIEKRSFKGLYCVGCEAFIRTSELIDGQCPDHHTVPEEVEEENWFFKVSDKYRAEILEYLKQDGVITPETRRQEAVSLVANGFGDFSISRPKDRLPWGISVPGDDSQVMYVWFDALTNYISTLGWPERNGNFNKFWQKGTTIQLAGKDQVRFQSLMWQVMLRSAGIKQTDQVVYHGHITSDGQKMSKSIGNVVSPFDLVNEYGADAVRYFLARHVHPFEDSDFTSERFQEAYNANLANGLGNLVARILKMSSQCLQRPVNVSTIEVLPAIGQFLESFEFNRAMNLLWSRIADLDGLIQTTKPFELIKTNSTKAEEQITRLIEELARIAKSLSPFMPATAAKIIDAIIANQKPENLFPRQD